MQPVALQPISFTTAESCCPASNWNQIIHADDTVSVAFTLSPCPEALNEVTNPEFQSGLTGWSSTGAVTATSEGAKIDAPGGQILQNLTTLTNGTFYKLIIRLTSDAGAPGQAVISANLLPDNVTIPTATGTYTIYFTADSFNLFIFGGSTTNGYTVNSVEVIEMELPDLIAEDLDGNLLSTSYTQSFEGNVIVMNFTPDAPTIAAKCFQIRVVQDCAEPISYTSEPIAIVPDSACNIRIGVCGGINIWEGAGFNAFVRLPGKLRADSYEPEVFRYRASNARYHVPFGYQRKIFTLYIERAPEHIRDFIAALPLMSTIAIQIGTGEQRNFVAYDSADAPAFSEGDDNLAGMQIQLIEQQNQLQAINSGDCAITLPPSILGSKAGNFAYQVGTDTVIQIP
jgi:hypothetical protein